MVRYHFFPMNQSFERLTICSVGKSQGYIYTDTFTYIIGSYISYKTLCKVASINISNAYTLGFSNFTSKTLSYRKIGHIYKDIRTRTFLKTQKQNSFYEQIKTK